MALEIIRPEDEIVAEPETDDDEGDDDDDDDTAAKMMRRHEDKMRSRGEDKSA